VTYKEQSELAKMMTKMIIVSQKMKMKKMTKMTMMMMMMMMSLKICVEEDTNARFVCKPV
jgi:type IV secretory pathway ATPase VirB11/archaellum biosynthesis ATPase